MKTIIVVLLTIFAMGAYAQGNMYAPLVMTASSVVIDYSDQFAGASLDPKWTEYDPQADVTVTVGSGVLTAAIPSGTDHDLYTAIDHALRLRQNYSGSANFTIEMKVTVTTTSNIQFFGLTADTDNNNLVRFGLVYADLDCNVDGAEHNSGTYSSTFWTNIGDQVQPYYLRMVKSGTNYACYHSLNGTDWTSDGTVVWEGTVAHIGMIVGTASGGASPAFNCTIDYFTYTAN